MRKEFRSTISEQVVLTSRFPVKTRASAELETLTHAADGLDCEKHSATAVDEGLVYVDVGDGMARRDFSTLFLIFPLTEGQQTLSELIEDYERMASIPDFSGMLTGAANG